MRRRGAEWAIRTSYTIGVVLVAALLALRLSHGLLPWWFDGVRDYDRGVHDPSVWVAFYAYLLFFGLLPALLGLVLAALSLRGGPDPWSWVGLVLNGAFALLSLRLYLVLAREGFFEFVLTAMPRFIDV
jgi:hypothetical protein